MCATLLSKAYFAGGYFDETYESIDDAFLTTVEAYNYETVATKIVKKKLYIFAIYVYSCVIRLGDHGIWESLPDMLVGRGDGVLVPVVNSSNSDYLLVAGGETHARGQVSQIPRHDVEVFYPTANVRIGQDDMIHSELGFYKLVSRRHLVISLCLQVWIPKAPIPTARFRFGAASDAQGIVYAIGGHDACTTNFDTGETDCPQNAHSTVEAFFLADEPLAFLYSAPMAD